MGAAHNVRACMQLCGAVTAICHSLTVSLLLSVTGRLRTAAILCAVLAADGSTAVIQ